MKLKKILYKSTLFLLTAGASLIIGLLSFGGMFALWPILPLAFATFVLSIAYEMEIYLQNIKGAWSKLFKYNSLQRQLAKDYLRDHFPDTPDEHGEHEGHDHDHDHEELASDCPQFFIDYEKQLKLLHVFGHKRLNKESQARRKAVEKTLRDMEKWFALQLFAADQPGNTPYESTLRTWLNQEARQGQYQDILQRLHSRQNGFWWAKYLSVFAGIFMGFGTTYLLVETFSIIPFFAALSLATWPLLILPMAAISGVAYGLLTYNAITDLITDDTLQEWLKYLGVVPRAANDAPHDHDAPSGEHKPVDTILSRITAWVLISLALGLTICTAGTWWTVVKETRPLFSWILKIPSFVMGVINPIITGFSAVVFNLQNTRESLELILDMVAHAGESLAYALDVVINGYSRLRKHENVAQVFNPFRILIFITITPLRVLLFLGHLVSIGVTADRLPGVSQKFSALLGFISELFEDLHYFFGQEHEHADPHVCDDHGHEGEHGDEHPHDEGQHRRELTKALLNERLGKGHGHSHDLDIPTAALKGFFTYIIPLYYLSVLWDWGLSRFNGGTHEVRHGTHENHQPYPLNYDDAAEKMGFHKEHDVTLPDDAARPSQDWTLTHTIYRIARYMEKETPSAQECAALQELQQGLSNGTAEAIVTTLDAAKSAPAYNAQRFFGSAPTPVFLGEELQQRVGLQAPHPT